MKATKSAVAVLLIFPIVLIGFAVGFIYTSLVVGFCGGASYVNKIGDTAIKESEERKK